MIFLIYLYINEPLQVRIVKITLKKIIMKKIIFITLTLLALLTMSCADESAIQSSKSITVWRSTGFPDSAMTTTFEYYEFRIVSDSSMELWVKRTTNENAEKVNQNYRYTLKDNVISIVSNEVICKGNIDKSLMSITENGITLDFKKI